MRFPRAHPAGLLALRPRHHHPDGASRARGHHHYHRRRPYRLSCGNLPTWATCTWAQQQIALTSTTSTYTTTVIIDTDEISDFAALHTLPRPGAPHPDLRAWASGSGNLACGLLLGFLTLRRRTRIHLALFLLGAAAITLALSGCSGQQPSSTAPGAYTIQINGTTATTHISHTANITLTVTQ